MVIRIVLLLVLAVLIPGIIYAFPDNGVLDDFNRANDATPPPGDNWTTTIGFATDTCGFNLNANAIRFNVTDTFWCSMYWNPATFGPDAEVFLELPSTAAISGGGQQIQLFVRGVVGAVDTFDGYTFQFFPPGSQIFINRVDNGVATQLGATISQGIDAADAIGGTAIGDQICAWFNNDGAGWTQLACRTDSTYTGAGRIGLFGAGNATSPFGDNFGGGTIGAPAGHPAMRRWGGIYGMGSNLTGRGGF